MSNVRLITCFGFCLLAVMCGGSLRADWTYEYTDDFSMAKASLDSYRHSTFWSKDQVPRPEPCLYYIDINKNRGLALADYNGRSAELGYCFPPTSTPAQRMLKGVLSLDVSFSAAEISQVQPGRLEYQTSSDGMDWSAAQVLSEGHHEIPISSTRGVCYILFSGTRVVIDNIAVSLYSTPVTIRVPQDFATIQAAIDAAGDGDMIELAKGTYSGSGNRDIQFRGKAITVRGAGPEDTIIDCGGSVARAEGGHRGFYFHQSEGAGSVLSDLTIKGGRVFGSEVPLDPLRNPSPTYPIGGGIYCENSSPTIVNCILRDCGAELGGGIGGVGAKPVIADCIIEECIAGGLGTASSGGRGAAIGLIANSNATITNCILRANVAYRNSYGAGLYFQQSAATVVGCTIIDNKAFSVRGGGAYCGGAATNVTFRNCVISQNSADAGAGLLAEWALDASLPSNIRSQRCRVSVVNCTIARNDLLTVTSGAAGGVQSSGAEVSLTSCIVWHNEGRALAIDYGLATAVKYCDIDMTCSGPGNINKDPLFAAEDAGDYHLKSKNSRYDPQAQRWVTDKVHSPCIDAGDPSASFGEEPLPNGNRINMGAYGGTKQASRSPEHLIYHVDPSGRDTLSNSGQSREQAFATIQYAVDAAKDGDTVLVWPGTYAEDLIFRGKAITVQSAADAAVLRGGCYAASFYYGESSRTVLANFVITACSQAGIFCQGASPTLRNLTIVGNTCGIVAYEASDPNINNCILWSNRDTDLQGCKAYFSDVEDGSDPKANTIRANPLFADPLNGDYHLKSSAGRWDAHAQRWVTDTQTSPCIDAGNPKDDYRAEPMPNGGRINMGAYGATPYASKSSR